MCFGSSPSVAFSGGLDKRVRQCVTSMASAVTKLTSRWDLESGQCKVLGMHDNAISSLAWCDEQSESRHPSTMGSVTETGSGQSSMLDARSLTTDVLVSGSWDSTLKVWDPYVHSTRGQAGRSAVLTLKIHRERTPINPDPTGTYLQPLLRSCHLHPAHFDGTPTCLGLFATFACGSIGGLTFET